MFALQATSLGILAYASFRNDADTTATRLDVNSSNPHSISKHIEAHTVFSGCIVVHTTEFHDGE